VRVGTRFLAAAEAAPHPVYLEALLRARAQDTVYTDAFAVGWPEAPHRVLRSCVAAARAFAGEVVGEQLWEGERRPWARYEIGVPDRATTGAVEAMPLWAGESESGKKCGRHGADERRGGTLAGWLTPVHARLPPPTNCASSCVASVR
jgi:NAD(P)H-dependent flavin oxidoreductase YrpB (nitropropane dioxygenase family)